MASTTEQAERYDAPENLSNLINWVAGVREEESDKNGSELVSDDEWRRLVTKRSGFSWLWILVCRCLVGIFLVKPLTLDMCAIIPIDISVFL
ncbi:uncharacterized protein LOC104896686 isoform X2 [Beta vulgaris subsp. vulgaris]|uniref:uncharacterized protein LOC104896686 isoform X2 n=1 Tax=Beta vulgaris subsp. vulgaris TaxID=3555 RepID=UPI002036F76E|nr:uncharacterized protein LOC104896686 isoform X2 [Beta vulgaris subsp. vulgaris]